MKKLSITDFINYLNSKEIEEVEIKDFIILEVKGRYSGDTYRVTNKGEYLASNDSRLSRHNICKSPIQKVKCLKSNQVFNVDELVNTANSLQPFIIKEFKTNEDLSELEIKLNDNNYYLLTDLTKIR